MIMSGIFILLLVLILIEAVGILDNLALGQA
jgi:hypothetical protein